MSEKEFEDILDDVRKKGSANKNNTADDGNDLNDYMDALSLVNENNRQKREQERAKRADAAAKKSNRSKGIIIAVLAVIIIAVVATVIALSHGGTDKPVADAPVQATDEVAINCLTGEAGFNKNAVGKRPVAVVVENENSTEAVRPQWAIDDADIVLEGESEYSSRLLFFWADYTAVPEMVGPVRSARPPFIRFSQLFDSIFIHAGLSKSKDNYVGADTVFESENVDHINLLNMAEDGTYFGRNRERGASDEHTAYLNGTNLSSLFDETDIRTSTDRSRFTVLPFADSVRPLSDIVATDCTFKISSGCAKTAAFTYDEVLHKYVTTDFDSVYGKSDVRFENLIFLFDETEYIVKEDYKNGQSETYCDYKLSGGEGKILSEGTAVDIIWGVENDKLYFKDTDGNPVQLNVGKSYIGYGSSNKDGSITINN